jgi:hypothetical protein
MTRSVTVDDNWSLIMVSISTVVTIPVYDDRSVSISIAVLVDNNRSITVAIPVAVVRPDWYATRTNTDPDLFCSGRHCAANTRRGSNYHYKTTNHWVLLIIERATRWGGQSFRLGAAFATLLGCVQQVGSNK